MSADQDDSGVVVCGNSDCRVAENGRCVEGFELDACPHYVRDALDQSEGGVVAQNEQGKGGIESVPLASADALTPSQASELLRTREARVIAIFGPLESGKTSLIASLYDLFQAGPVVGIEFARSRTLHAFERTCHDARSASRRGEPHMYRTNRGEVRFFHLEVGGGAVGDGLSLIVGDRSGEEYQEAAANTSSALTFLEVVRADSLTVLVDGERLLDTGARHNLRGEIILMLQSLRDGDAMRTGSRMAFVLTKLDAVLGSPYAERAASDFDHLVGHIRTLFGDIFSAIEPFKIAASPKSDASMRGKGVPDLLSFWLQPAAMPAPCVQPSPSFERAFARMIPLEELTE